MVGYLAARPWDGQTDNTVYITLTRRKRLGNCQLESFREMAHLLLLGLFEDCVIPQQVRATRTLGVGPGSRHTPLQSWRLSPHRRGEAK